MAPRLVQTFDPHHLPMPQRIYLDLSRLIYAAGTRTPVGIPRIELAYAEYFIANFPDHLQFVVVDAARRFRLLDYRRGADFVTAISEHWRNGVSSNRSYLSLVFRHVRIHAGLLFRRRTGLSEALDKDATVSIYIISSQLHMERRATIARLKKSGRLRLVYFVHDILPVTYPEYFPPDAERRCLRRMQSAAQLADVIVVASQDTANAFRKVFAPIQSKALIVVAPPGLNIAVVSHRVGTAPPPSPYFVMVGTIEPRKNHLLVLNLWRLLNAELGLSMPRLILVGSRGWENENVVDMLERSPALTGIVEERGRVSDQEMTQLLMGARALLLPSFAEGYGLPLAEALALGVPVLCSDIPVFHEVGGEAPDFIDPLDGPGWRQAILDYMAAGSLRRQAQIERLRAWHPPTWESHFDKVMSALDATSDRPGST